MSEVPCPVLYSFVRESLRILLELTSRLKTKIDKVYVYDNSSYFLGVQPVLFDSVRVQIKNGKFAMLSVAAQNTLSMEQFTDIMPAEYDTDEIGVFIKFNS